MKTQAEHLPNELWLSIFSYLEAHDLFHGFIKLNHRFDQLLASDYLTFYVHLKKQNNHHIQYIAAPRWFDGILKRIVFLQSTTQSGCEYIPEYLRRNTHKFIQLRSLTITTNTHQTNIICRILQKLSSLEYLSITCQITSILIKTILNIPTLHVFHLNVKKSI